MPKRLVRGLAGWDFNEGSALDLVSAGNIYHSEVEETGGPEWLTLGARREALAAVEHGA